MEIVFIVDDNLIGNKKAIRSCSTPCGRGRRRTAFRSSSFTEASLDLADDAGLMRLMVDANILSVFIGIESPNEESLRETKKFQNVQGRPDARRARPADPARRARGLVRDDRRLRHDDETIFDAQREFLREARIAQAMIGMLYADPQDAAARRLAAEGRLDAEDDCRVRHQRRSRRG